MNTQSRESRRARIGTHTNTYTHKTQDIHADRLGSHADRLNMHPHNKHPPPHTHYTGKNRVDRTDLDCGSVRYMSRQGYDRTDLDIELAPTLDSHRTERDTHRIDRGQDGPSHKHHLRSHINIFLHNVHLKHAINLSPNQNKRPV